jgi:hypothetical protein
MKRHQNTDNANNFSEIDVKNSGEKNKTDMLKQSSNSKNDHLENERGCSSIDPITSPVVDTVVVDTEKCHNNCNNSFGSPASNIRKRNSFTVPSSPSPPLSLHASSSTAAIPQRQTPLIPSLQPIQQHQHNRTHQHHQTQKNIPSFSTSSASTIFSQQMAVAALNGLCAAGRHTGGIDTSQSSFPIQPFNSAPVAGAVNGIGMIPHFLPPFVHQSGLMAPAPHHTVTGVKGLQQNLQPFGFLRGGNFCPPSAGLPISLSPFGPPGSMTSDLLLHAAAAAASAHHTGTGAINTGGQPMPFLPTPFPFPPFTVVDDGIKDAPKV